MFPSPLCICPHLPSITWYFAHMPPPPTTYYNHRFASNRLLVAEFSYFFQKVTIGHKLVCIFVLAPMPVPEENMPLFRPLPCRSSLRLRKFCCLPLGGDMTIRFHVLSDPQPAGPQPRLNLTHNPVSLCRHTIPWTTPASFSTLSSPSLPPFLPFLSFIPPLPLHAPPHSLNQLR